jgi:hypothetical protein
MAETVPGFLRVKEHAAADGAACGKEVLPEQRYKASEVFHGISIAAAVRKFRTNMTKITESRPNYP